MTHQPTERYKWFQSKVGSTLYRSANGCSCLHCLKAQEYGIFVTDKQHASYLYDFECDYNREGTPLRYFDSRQEVEDWLKTLPK